MKFFHLSDLHLGKRLFEFSLTCDQQYILGQILAAIDTEHPDAIVIAGDIYDKPVPPAEAVALFDSFLSELNARSVPTLIISGNHDSPERIAFGSKLMSPAGIHLSPVWDGNVTPVSFSDAHGTVNFYLLPFIKPAHVRRYFPDESCESYTDALRIAIREMSPDHTVRNVLVTHQFITGAERSDSEEISVGGSDNVDVSVLDGFDYVALGHLHCPQSVGSDTVRYCGTPLKYSFSEVSQKKSVTVVDMGKKGDISVTELPLIPCRDLRELRGSYDSLTLRKNYEGTATDDYIHITLTDEDDIPDAITKLRVIYPNLMKLDYDNRRTRFSAAPLLDTAAEKRSPLELFADFFEKQNDRPLDDEQREFVSELIEKLQSKEGTR
ncbi:MAG: exonuclease SbcCD subunit D [Clostridia bacterium]|nr:exonuclease SbcCD subunit D [Clostridia bacterium]